MALHGQFSILVVSKAVLQARSLWKRYREELEPESWMKDETEIEYGKVIKSLGRRSSVG
jgi:hypothetical protein